MRKEFSLVLRVVGVSWHYYRSPGVTLNEVKGLCRFRLGNARQRPRFFAEFTLSAVEGLRDDNDLRVGGGVKMHPRAVYDFRPKLRYCAGMKQRDGSATLRSVR